MKNLNRPIEIWQDVSLALILWGYGGNWRYVRLQFYWSCHLDWDVRLKRGGHRIMRHWFWNRGLKQLLHTCIGDWIKFHPELVCFFTVFSQKQEKLLKALLTYTFKLFDLPCWSSKSRKILESVLICLEGGSFGSCPALEANELPRVRFYLRGLGHRRKLWPSTMRHNIYL